MNPTVPPVPGSERQKRGEGEGERAHGLALLGGLSCPALDLSGFPRSHVLVVKRWKHLVATGGQSGREGGASRASDSHTLSCRGRAARTGSAVTPAAGASANSVAGEPACQTDCRFPRFRGATMPVAVRRAHTARFARQFGAGLAQRVLRGTRSSVIARSRRCQPRRSTQQAGEARDG